MAGALTSLPIYLQDIHRNTLSSVTQIVVVALDLYSGDFLLKSWLGYWLSLQRFSWCSLIARLMLDICLTKTDLGCVKTYEQKSHAVLCAWWNTWCL